MSVVRFALGAVGIVAVLIATAAFIDLRFRWIPAPPSRAWVGLHVAGTVCALALALVSRAELWWGIAALLVVTTIWGGSRWEGTPPPPRKRG